MGYWSETAPAGSPDWSEEVVSGACQAARYGTYVHAKIARLRGKRVCVRCDLTAWRRGDNHDAQAGYYMTAAIDDVHAEEVFTESLTVQTDRYSESYILTRYYYDELDEGQTVYLRPRFGISSIVGSSCNLTAPAVLVPDIRVKTADGWEAVEDVKVGGVSIETVKVKTDGGWEETA